MLTEICAYLKNYFCFKGDRIIGDFSVVDGAVVPSFSISDGQYYRIVGSVFNDGVHKFGDAEDTLKDEGEFHGAVWLMRVPQDVIDLAQDIKNWQDKYGGIDGANMSPYSSESFGGYSYTKASGSSTSSASSTAVTTWKDVFASRLAPYRRIRVI